MDCLMEFSERVRKVQTLFNRLQDFKWFFNMSSIPAEKEATHEDPATWHRWCRLCAQDHLANRNVYSREEHQNSGTSMLAMTVGKYFWVDVNNYY